MSGRDHGAGGCGCGGVKGLANWAPWIYGIFVWTLFLVWSIVLLIYLAHARMQTATSCSQNSFLVSTCFGMHPLLYSSLHPPTHLLHLICTLKDKHVFPLFQGLGFSLMQFPIMPTNFEFIKVSILQTKFNKNKNRVKAAPSSKSMCILLQPGISGIYGSGAEETLNSLCRPWSRWWWKFVGFIQHTTSGSSLVHPINFIKSISFSFFLKKKGKVIYFFLFLLFYFCKFSYLMNFL